MRNNFENRSESLNYPKVVMHFMRHSIKENPPVNEDAPKKEDAQIILSEPGRVLAAEKFPEKTDLRVAHIEGSPRVRTHETGVIAATKDATMNPKDIGTGKLRINEALDFVIDGEGVYAERIAREYEKGTLLSFFVNESDSLAREIGDTKSSTYSKLAANIAGIVYKNFQAASRGVSVLEQSKSTENAQNDFERIFATHGIIQESFLLKVAEKVKGIAERDTLLSVIGENGFDYVEGFDAILSKENGEEQIRIVYKKGDYVFNEVVPETVIQEIISEGQR